MWNVRIMECRSYSSKTLMSRYVFRGDNYYQFSTAYFRFKSTSGRFVLYVKDLSNDVSTKIFSQLRTGLPHCLQPSE